MSDDITYTQIADAYGARWWVATRDRRAAPIGVGEDQHEALEALLRAEHKATT